MKKRDYLPAPLLGFLVTILFFSLMNRTTAHAPFAGDEQGSVQPQASNAFFTLTVTPVPNPVSVGTVLRFDILVTPLQSFDRIVLNGNIPPNTAYCPGSGTSAGGYIFTPPSGDGNFDWTNTSPPPANTTTALSFRVLVNSNAPINSNITLTIQVVGFLCTPGCSPVPGSELFQTVSALVQPAITIDKTIVSVANPAVAAGGVEGEGLLVEPNGSINYRLRVTNFTKAIKHVIVIDELPPQTTFVKITHQVPSSSSLFGCDVPPIGGMGMTHCEFFIGPADTVISDIEVKVKPNVVKGDLLINCANAITDSEDCGSGAPGNISVFDCVTLAVGELSDLMVEKSVKNVKTGGENLPGDRAEVGDILKYEIKVTNKGPGDAQNVRVADVLDPNLTLIPAPNPLYCAGSGGVCDTCQPYATGDHSCDSVGNSLTIIYPKLKNGQQETITLFARVNCVSAETAVQNTVTVRVIGEGNEDGKPGNNSASVSTIVNKPVPSFNCTPTTVVHPVQLCPGETSAVVLVPPPSVVNACDDLLTVVGTRSDGKPLDAPYPVGETLVNWALVNAAGQPPTGFPCTRTTTTVRVNQKTNAITVTPPNFAAVLYEGKKLPKKPFKANFTLTNTCGSPLTVQVLNIQRDAAALCNAGLTDAERDDSLYFQILDANGNPLAPGNFVTLTPGTHNFTLQFKAFTPSLAANPNRLIASEVLPTDFTKTVIHLQIVGGNIVEFRPQGIISDNLIKLLDPVCASRDGDNFTARIGVLDPTLKVQRIAVEFLNDAGQRLGNEQSFTPTFNGKCMGQRYYLEITQATQNFPPSVRMRVRVIAGSLSRSVEVPVGQSCQLPGAGQSITVEKVKAISHRP
jgi:uncharacterized repeat protein (TIGR01451 family)